MLRRKAHGEHNVPKPYEPDDGPLTAAQLEEARRLVPQDRVATSRLFAGVRLLVLSDLHVEFAPFEPDRAAVEQADVIVLAGDISTGSSGLRWARGAFGTKPVIYVAGNHEFYGGHWDKTLAELRTRAQEFAIHFLENEAVEVAGLRFLGCTLWTDFELDGAERRSYRIREAERMMMDYRTIKARPIEQQGVQTSRHRLTPWHTLQRHRTSKAWLAAQLSQGDPARTVVVIHHMPDARSIAPRFIGNTLNPAFGSQLPQEMLERAALWVHGHTHDSSDYEVGARTRVICNPRGYPLRNGEFENSAFQPELLIPVGERP